MISYIKARLQNLTFWLGLLGVLAEFTIHLNDFSPLMTFVYGLIAVVPVATLNSITAWLNVRASKALSDLE